MVFVGFRRRVTEAANNGWAKPHGCPDCAPGSKKSTFFAPAAEGLSIFAPIAGAGRGPFPMLREGRWCPKFRRECVYFPREPRVGPAPEFFWAPVGARELLSRRYPGIPVFFSA